MSDYTDPWHTLTVTSTYYHDDPMCDAAIDANGQCPSHNETDDTIRERENEYDLAHPDDCPIPERPCCCKVHAEFGGAYDRVHIHVPEGSKWACECEKCSPWQPCPPCAEAQHGDCHHLGPRCWTEHQVYECAMEFGLDDLDTGTYRIQMSSWHSSTPNGEDYDEEMTIEEVTV